MKLPRMAAVLLPVSAALALAACGQEEETVIEADAEDLSGGELVTRPADQAGVPVDVPETEMTPVMGATASPTGSPTPQ